jgi:hypothetical protein
MKRVKLSVTISQQTLEFLRQMQMPSLGRALDAVIAKVRAAQ